MLVIVSIPTARYPTYLIKWENQVIGRIYLDGALSEHLRVPRSLEPKLRLVAKLFKTT